MRCAATMHNLLITILLATHATAYAAEGPFIPIDLGTLGGSQSSASDVNTSGQVVGASNGRALLWTQAGGRIDLGTLGGWASKVAAVNADGQVAGSSALGGPYSQTHAFLWTPAAGMIDLDPLGGFRQAAAMNANGQVVGWSRPGGAFSWTPDG